MPGGVINPDALRTDPDAVALVQAFAAAGKPVAAICHGPWLLVEADVLKGRKATGWKSIRTDLRNAGAEVSVERVVRDGPFITAQAPEDVEAFTEALIAAIEQSVKPAGNLFAVAAPDHGRGARQGKIRLAGGACRGAGARACRRLPAFKLAPSLAVAPSVAMTASGFGGFGLGLLVMRMVKPAPRSHALMDFQLVPIEAVEEPLLLDDIYEEPLVPSGAADEALLLDDPLVKADPGSRVVQLFASQPLPTPGQLKERIDRHLAGATAARPTRRGHPPGGRRPARSTPPSTNCAAPCAIIRRLSAPRSSG